jgi:hypothetical protein
MIVIAIARMAPSTVRRSGIRPADRIIILVYCLITIQWSHSEEVAWLLLLTAWWLNYCPEIIDTVPREIVAGGFNLSPGGCLRIGAIDLIPNGMGVVPPPIFHLTADCVKHLPQK